MWIQNVSLDDVVKAWHYDPGPNSMLISIVDHDMENPPAKYPFKTRLNFKFLDVEDEQEHAITDKQAFDIACALQLAKDLHMNVITHCVAGICRSGAVAEAGIAMGFEDTGTMRIPNLRVKHMLFEHLSDLGAL
jgi:predicted protein tyrosine phosphatase